MIITPEQFNAIHQALPDDPMRLLVETAIESGLRWGELTTDEGTSQDVTLGARARSASGWLGSSGSGGLVPRS